ncbi:hypothetical protein SISSUDRAFT_529490 [Sistotremastrum suecicum HHB10207 ss-3]|uniref:Uncharacterized protein n=1 Tax=Sistotremastrum suecicum HHB10207 ss-3 TaxID=1314776 RepID=A0A165XTQ9_9AGAM|nr:hypothetical protein SISSUDRAFT_529490 [Sistotremastrum suecicum HHB10207 ss-3]
MSCAYIRTWSSVIARQYNTVPDNDAFVIRDLLWPALACKTGIIRRLLSTVIFPPTLASHVLYCCIMSTSAESSSQGARNANATQNPSLSAWGTDRLSLCTLPRVLWEKLETSSQRFNSLKCEYQGYEEVAVFQEEREVDLDEIKKLPDWDLSCITTGELGLHLLSVLTGLYLYDGLRKICPIFFQISDFTKPHSTNYDCSVILEKRFGPMGSPIKPSQFTPAGSTSDPRKVRELIRQVEESLIGDYHINYEPIASATPVAPHLSCPLYDIIHVRIHRTGAPAVVVKEFPDKRSSWWKDSPRSSWFFNTAYTTFLVTKSPSGPESEANDDSPLPLPTLGSNILCESDITVTQIRLCDIFGS